MIERVYISEEAAALDRSRTVADAFEAAGAKIFEGRPDPSELEGRSLGKKALTLEVFKGPFYKPCPCSRGVFGCGYKIISPLIGCPFDCSYCVLREYLNAPTIVAYVNYEDMLLRLERELARRGPGLIRVGTGELGDSLGLEPELGVAQTLVSFFADKKNALFELKTKSDRVSSLLKLDHGGRTVIGFSIGPSLVAEEEETGSAPLSKRIEAASLSARSGYKTAFHFDPIIDLDPLAEPEESVAPYLEPVRMIYESVPPSSIAWISLGALRFSRGLYSAIRERVPGGRLAMGEFYPGFDGKARYTRIRRRRMLAAAAGMILERHRDAPLYLCMEDAEMVEKVLGRARLPFDPLRQG